MKHKLKLTTFIAGALTLGGLAEEKEIKKDITPKVESPWERSDGQWLTISGKVVEAAANHFKLDYGKGAIIVELDDYDPKLEGFNIIKDDQVIVVGRVDADPHQKRTIEAASVYVKNAGQTFFASPDDEEEAMAKLRKSTLDGTQVRLEGQITSILKEWVVIDTGYQLLNVSTQGIGAGGTDDPIPAMVKRLKIGDQVRIYGAITDGFVNSNKLIASRIEKK